MYTDKFKLQLFTRYQKPTLDDDRLCHIQVYYIASLQKRTEGAILKFRAKICTCAVIQDTGI